MSYKSSEVSKLLEALATFKAKLTNQITNIHDHLSNHELYFLFTKEFYCEDEVLRVTLVHKSGEYISSVTRFDSDEISRDGKKLIDLMLNIDTTPSTKTVQPVLYETISIEERTRLIVAANFDEILLATICEAKGIVNIDNLPKDQYNQTMAEIQRMLRIRQTYERK